MQTASEQHPAADNPVDEVLAAAIDVARQALIEDIPVAMVGAHVGVSPELTSSGHALTHRFVATLPGYVGWYWAISLSRTVEDERITINEVVLLPGDGSIRLEPWVPWAQRIRPDDLHPGDLVPTDPADDRLVPGYTLSDDPQIEAVETELGLGRERVLSRDGRLDAAARWGNGPHSSTAAMARHAPAHCGTCGFYLPLGGSMQGLFGACANEVSPADAQVVAADFGCGAHSDATRDLELRLAKRRPLIYNTRAVDVTTLPRGGTLSAERRAIAVATLAAVRLDAEQRRNRAKRSMSAAQVISAVRLAFAERQKTPATSGAH
ncbi:MAG: DUF3027 domain-containing protein [Cumulibacter sp.]